MHSSYNTAIEPIHLEHIGQRWKRCRSDNVSERRGREKVYGRVDDDTRMQVADEARPIRVRASS